MRILLASAAALLAVSVTAQSPVRASLATDAPIGVNANRQTDLARGGVAIDPALGLRASDERDAFSTSLAAVQNDRLGTGASVRWSARASSGNTAGTLGGNPPAAGAQTYTLSLVSRQPVQGRVVVLFGGDATNARCGASVRIGRDRKDFSATGMPQREAFENVTVDGSGVDVAISVGGDATADANTRFAAYNGSLTIRFVADGGGPGCTVEPGVRSCQEGGVLRGRAAMTRRGGTLALNLEGALADAIGVTVVSPSPRTFDIGQTGCVFLATPIVHATFTTDANGAAQNRVDFPMLRGGSFSVQQATILVSQRGVRFATSNTLNVDCN